MNDLSATAPPPRSIAVVSGKGGVGKTTTSLGIAGVIADLGRSVVVVDTDPQDHGSASWWLNSTDDERLSFITGTGAELAVNHSKLEQDHIVVDTPPRLDDDDLDHVLEIADLALVLSQPAALDVAAAAQTIASRVRPAGTPYLLVLTQVDGRSLAEAHDARLELLAAGHRVAGPVIRQFAAVRRAPLEAMLPTQATEKHRDDVASLVTEISLMGALA